MNCRQLFDESSHTYSYLLWCESNNECLIIDPVIEQVERDLRLIKELGLNLLLILETHVHADHVTGAGKLRDATKAVTVSSAAAGVACVDKAIEHGETLSIGEIVIEARLTPGHTNGCTTYVAQSDDKTIAFTGDAMLIRSCGRTDFQQGNSSTLFKSVHEQLFTLPDSTIVFPAHDYQGQTSSTIGEEKRFNKRLNLEILEPEFLQIMADLELSDPKMMDLAIPANLACGKSADLIKSISPEDLQRTHNYRVIDVREPNEVNSKLGRIEDSENVPLMQLDQVSDGWDKETSYLIVCRSGKRSMKACGILIKKGFTNITNLSGGMLAFANQGPSPEGGCG